MTMLEQATVYAKLGIRVIPIKPGTKYPPIKEWQKVATTDLAQITSWWTNQYSGYGIGIATGPTKHTQIFVLDVDDRDEYRGSDTLALLEQANNPLPDTVEALTGSGGRHLYFTTTVDVHNNAGTRLGQGLDIRGIGGQVLAPPTLHPDTGRPYQWVDEQSPSDRKPAPAPDWLIHLLTKQPDTIKPANTGDQFLNDPTTPSSRYDAQTTWEQHLGADGWTLAKTDRHGEQHWVRPGKDPRDGTSATLGHNGGDHLIVFTSSIPWLPEGGYTRFGYMAARDHHGDWKQATKHFLQTQKTQPNEPLPAVTGDEMLSMLVNWKQFWNQDHTDEDWIAKPLIARGRQTALYAAAKEGKSWLTLNIVAALATGKPILGQPAQAPQHVLYLDYEMVEADLYERLEQFGYNEDDNLSHLHYAIIPSLPPLNTVEGAAAVLKLCELTQSMTVIIDTTGRAIEGEENSADSYREFARTTGLTLKRAGIALLRTDHAGKDGGKKLGQRGSSAKNDDVDIVYRLNKTEGGITLTRTHSRIGWAPAVINLIIDNLNDDDTTSIALKHTPTRGYTTTELTLAKKLTDLGYRSDQGINEIMKQAKLNGHRLGRRTTLSRALDALKTPRPDPLNPPTPQHPRKDIW